MLYVSTRSQTDTFTAYRAIHEDRAPDGGLFVPFRFPTFTSEELRILSRKSFGENVAYVLNFFFSSGLSGWDVDFLIGREPVRIATMTHRLVVGEVWHNPKSCYAYLEQILYDRISGLTGKQPTDWAKIAIRIAVLFGLFAQLNREGIHKIDVAVPAGDFAVPMAVWYARKMGLSIGMIVCGCNENSACWDLLERGELYTGASVVHTELPDLDHACPASLERLIYSCLGFEQARNYARICQINGLFTLNEDSLETISDGLTAPVVSSRRSRSVIASTYRSNKYVVDGYTAVAYGGLQDYRASTGESHITLLLSDTGPVQSS